MNTIEYNKKLNSFIESQIEQEVFTKQELFAACHCFFKDSDNRALEVFVQTAKLSGYETLSEFFEVLESQD